MRSSERLALRDVVIASGACTDSSMNRIAFEGLDYAPVADFGLLRAAVEAVEARADSSTRGRPTARPRRAAVLERLVLRGATRARRRGWSGYGVLAVEMEASALYTLAAKHGRRALAICTVSDHIVTGAETTAAEREQTFGEMVEIALTAALSSPAG